MQDDAETVASLLSGGPAHPWIETRTPTELAADAHDRVTLTAVLAVTDKPALTPAGDTTIQRLAARGRRPW